MVKNRQGQVRLAPADWGGLLALAVTMLGMIGATLFQVHDLNAASRARQAVFENELGHLQTDVRTLKTDVRTLLRKAK